MKGLFGQIRGVLGGDRNALANAPHAAPVASIQDALAHHQAGRLHDADAIYRRILIADPRNFDALHLSGLVCHQKGNHREAVALITRALAIQPNHPFAHGNVAMAYLASDRIDEAEASLRRALTLKPDWDDGHNRLGTVLKARGDVGQAELCFRKSLEVNARNAEALNNLASIRKDAGDLVEAEKLYNRTLELSPDFVETHNNLGGLFLHRGELERAEACFQRALVLRPEHAESHNNLGTVFQAQGRLNEAEVCFHTALEYRSEFAEALSNLGDVLQALGRLDEAEAYCRSALALKPDLPEGLTNLGVVLKQRGDLSGAEDCFRRALATDPRYVTAHINLGTIFSERGLPAEAERWYRSALALDPNRATAQFNLSMLLLLRKEYEEGFRLYESRFRSFTRTFAGSRGLHDRLKEQPSWRGDFLSGKRILVWTEQGMGDSIMMMRFLPMLQERGAEAVTVFCERALARVIQSMRGVDTVMCEPPEDFETAFDLHCPMMSLPHLLQTRRDTVPCEVPYLVVPEELCEEWRRRLSVMSGIKVGLTWAGSKTLRDDAKRSVALHELASLAEIDGVQLVSLQKDQGVEHLKMVDWMDDCDDFMDTAGLIENLDLVISVDTAVTHLSGALGKPTWLLNRFHSEWRWGLGRRESDWYPSMRIFSQTRDSDWRSVVSAIAADLRLMAANERQT